MMRYIFRQKFWLKNISHRIKIVVYKFLLAKEQTYEPLICSLETVFLRHSTQLYLNNYP
jgi:hypothetical protein